MLIHECRQLVAHRFDHAVAPFHHAGADLDAIGAQQNELGRVVSGFDPPIPLSVRPGNSSRITVAISMQFAGQSA